MAGLSIARVLRACAAGLRRALPALALALALTPALAFAQVADIVVYHSDSPDPGPAGGTFTYTIRVDNNGPNTATNVAIADTLPTGAIFVSAVPTAGSCDAAPVAGVINCALGNIPFTSSRTVVLKVKLPTAGTYTNVVNSTSDTSDSNTGNNTNSRETTTANSAADMQLTATAPANVTAGQPFNYTLTATNLGPDGVPAGGTISIQFTVPAGAAITAIAVGGGWSCPATPAYPRLSGTITCTRPGSLGPAGAAPALTVPAVTNVNGAVTAAFAVSSTMPDGDAANNTATVNVASGAGSDVSITKVASPTIVAQGGNVTYTLTPRHNGGIAPASTGGQIMVTDTLGAGLTFVSAAGSG